MKRRQNKYKRIAGLAALITTLVVSGCSNVESGPSGVSGNEKNNAGSKKAVKLVLPTGGTPDEEPYYQNQAKKFNELNPDIDLQVQFIPSAQYGNTTSLMFASDDWPDIIRMNGSIATKMTISYEKGWIRPLDEFVTNEFKKRFPDNFFSPGGRLYIDGKLYGIPFNDNRETTFRPLYVNLDILKQFGYSAPPKTWTELREMGAKITKQGGGKIYGFSTTSSPYLDAINLFETNNGRYLDAHLTEGSFYYDTKTGKSAAANPQLVEAVKFMQSINADKTFMPGFESVDLAKLYQQFAAGNVAMFIGQNWVAPEIRKLNPQINMMLASMPVPDSGRKGYKAIYGVSEPFYGITSKSKHPEAAWKAIEFFSTPDFHEGWYNIVQLPTVFFDRYKFAQPDEKRDQVAKQILEGAKADLRVAPYPTQINPNAEKFLAAIQANAPKPSLNELINLAVIGNKDFEALAKEYDQKMEKIVDEQIAAMAAAGMKISRDVLIAPSDWDPAKDYIK
ncbi:ABC transporter substrate-binding protein [Paenibacillus piri]|uniref:Sugar ABC transporter substrate-binding protein n=1 Tax=Paenibacillus piri TaxID=2547395 RepID=A0A4R5KSQ7_9BACL|nr:sugar ABC transporter substrate-binding protein [Paenibacillus piri]TDF98841.1 sugar ABC transporter substrate-binding protein [Paenibacillus piri]